MAATFSYAELVALLDARGFPDPHLAAAVALAESGGDPSNTNTANSDGSIDRGLFQINSVHGADSTHDLDRNIEAAFRISKGGTDWRAWVAFTNNSFRKYLDRTVASAGGRRPAKAATPATPGSELFGEQERSGAVKALLSVAFVLGGFLMAVFGLVRLSGVRIQPSVGPLTVGRATG